MTIDSGYREELEYRIRQAVWLPGGQGNDRPKAENELKEALKNSKP